MSSSDDDHTLLSRPRALPQADKPSDRWGSDVIVDLMHRYDLAYAALNPGASYRGLHDSIVNYGGNVPVMMLCQHEETAVQIAHGFAKASGKPMIAILHDPVGLLPRTWHCTSREGAANNLILWACLVANHEGLALAQRHGVDVDALREALLISSAANGALSNWGLGAGRHGDRRGDGGRVRHLAVPGRSRARDLPHAQSPAQRPRGVWKMRENERAMTASESHYHSRKDRVFVRGVEGQYNLKEEIARLRAMPRVRKGQRDPLHRRAADIQPALRRTEGRNHPDVPSASRGVRSRRPLAEARHVNEAAFYILDGDLNRGEYR